LALGVAESGAGDEPPVHTVRQATVIFAPCHLVCVLVEVASADPMMLADLSAAQPGEK
jgi:hypothetical protein